MIEKRRDELLAKAAELFQKKGYHATTMKDIAGELQILPGTLYTMMKKEVQSLK